jgi:hypothetical protein
MDTDKKQIVNTEDAEKTESTEKIAKIVAGRLPCALPSLIQFVFICFGFYPC